MTLTEKKDRITFSVVVPVYNSEKSLEELYQRLDKTFRQMEESFEVIFINDYSKDQSYAVLREIHKAHPENTIIIDLIRNYGQHNAIMCGFNFCNGKFIITIDDDLQNPPEEIPSIYKKINEGYDVVFGIPEEKKHSAYKNFGSLFIRRLNRKIFNIKGKLAFSSFRIIRNEIVGEVKSIKTPFPYISGMLLSVTKAVANQEVKHASRQHGRSNYNISKLINLSFNLLINYSSIPLRLIGTFGFIISIISFLIGSIYIIRELLIGQAPQGWTTLVVLISFYNAVFLVFFSIMGEYISRLLTETSKISQFSIRSINGDPPNEKRRQISETSVKYIDQ